MTTNDVAQEPATIEALAECIRATPHVIPVGQGTKPRLSRVPEKFVRVSTRQLRGIVEYEPSEFTFTALAGTPLREIAAALAERGQYLPFDPLLADAGATLGGTVAAGLSGPGRWRFGGLRDFILGVKFVDGEARVLRMGGKVVKNAAGFDLPKFFVGSVGRFGVMAEISFKVFPRPEALRTLRIEAPDIAAKTRILTEAASARWELDALDAAVEEPAVFARIGGAPAAIEALSTEILARWPGTVLTPGDGNLLWRDIAGLKWAHTGGTLFKVALTPKQVPDFGASCTQWRGDSGARGWIGAGGNAGYISLPPGTPAPAVPWPGITLRGEGALWLGPQRNYEIMRAVKGVLDPQQRFPGVED